MADAKEGATIVIGHNAKDKEELQENINQLHFSFPLKLKNISQKNKEDIYFKLNNMNSEF